MQRTEDSGFDDGFAAADISDHTDQRYSRHMLTDFWSDRRKSSKAQVMLVCILVVEYGWMAVIAIKQNHRTCCFPSVCILVPLTYNASVTPACSFCILDPTGLLWSSHKPNMSMRIPSEG